MKFFLPLSALIAMFSQISTLYPSASIVLLALLALWAFTGAAMAYMLVSRRIKQAKILKHLEMLVDASKGKFFSVSFNMPDGRLKIVNGKNFYKRLLKRKGVRDLFVNRNQDAWCYIKNGASVRFKCGSLNTIVGY